MKEAGIFDYDKLYPTKYELNRREHELIYRTRKTLNDFYSESLLWKHLVKLYTDLHCIWSKGRCINLSEDNILEALNEAKSICVRMMLDKYPEENTWMKYFNFLDYNRERIAMLVYAILSLIKIPVPKLIRVQQCLLHSLEVEEIISKEFKVTNDFIEEIRSKELLFTLDLSSQPELPEDIYDWSKHTQSFKEEQIRTCLEYWENVPERLHALQLMEESYKKYISHKRKGLLSLTFYQDTPPCWIELRKEIKDGKFALKVNAIRKSISDLQEENKSLRERIAILQNQIQELQNHKIEITRAKGLSCLIKNADGYITTEEVKTPSLISCIDILMDEMDENVKNKSRKYSQSRYLVSRGNHWIAIFRIVVDKKLGVTEDDYEGFCNMINRLKPEGFRIPLKKQDLKNISKFIYHKPFDEWKYDTIYHKKRSPYDKMVRVATRFKEILEENGL